MVAPDAAIKFFGSFAGAVHLAQNEAPRIHFKHKVKPAREPMSNLEIVYPHPW